MANARRYILNKTEDIVSGTSLVSVTTQLSLIDSFSGTNNNILYSYSEITLSELSQLTNFDYEQRLSDFLVFTNVGDVQKINNLKNTSSFETIDCVPVTTTTTVAPTTTAAPTTTTTTTTIAPLQVNILGLSDTNNEYEKNMTFEIIGGVPNYSINIYTKEDLKPREITLVNLLYPYNSSGIKTVLFGIQTTVDVNRIEEYIIELTDGNNNMVADTLIS